MNQVLKIAISVYASYLLLAPAPERSTVYAGAPEPPPALRPLEKYGVDFFDETAGLPQSRIRAMVQTPDGYLWLGTDNGLVRFDGAAFTTFGVQTGSLVDNEVGALTLDGEGGLWAGTYGGGLAHMSHGQFTRYTTKDGIPDDIIRWLDRGPDGSIWFTTSSGLGRYAGGRFTTFTTRDGLPANDLSALCARSAEGIFVSDGQMLARFENGRFVPAGPEGLVQRYGTVNSLGADRDGALFIVLSRAVARLRQGGISVTELENSSGTTGRVMHQDPSGTIWLGSREGLFRLNGSRLEALPSAGVRSRMGVVYSLLTDREGSLWIGLEANGLARLRPVQIGWIGAEDGLPDARARAILQDRGGTTWIGTSRGLMRSRGGPFEPVAVSDPSHIMDISALGQDREGTLWAGSIRKLYRLQNGRLEPCSAWADRGNIRSIYGDPLGGLWIGSDGNGLFRIEGNRIESVFRGDSPGQKRIRDVLRDRHGALWAATFGGGVVRFAADGSTLYTVENGLGSDFTLDLFEDRRGTLWVTTRSGLSCFQNGRFVNISAREGLYCSFIHSMEEDAAGDFWFSCVQGVFKVSGSEIRGLMEGKIKEVSSRHFGFSEGMKTLSCTAGTFPSSCRTADGRMMFCTLKGVAVVDLEDRIANLQAPPVLIERMKINGRPCPWDKEGIIAPGQGEVEITYTATTFLEQNQVRFRYMLGGYDADWVEAGSRRFAYYAGLPPGSYRFQVIACNGNKVWNQTGAATAFRLQPHFYQTAWFMMLCMAAAALLVWGGHTWRIRRLKAAERELKNRVDVALAKVKVLSGLLPVCANCRKVRNDQGYWNSLEQYIVEHSDTRISHGICPDCIRELYPDMADSVLSAKTKEP